MANSWFINGGDPITTYLSVLGAHPPSSWLISHWLCHPPTGSPTPQPTLERHDSLDQMEDIQVKPLANPTMMGKLREKPYSRYDICIYIYMYMYMYIYIYILGKHMIYAYDVYAYDILGKHVLYHLFRELDVAALGGFKLMVQLTSTAHFSGIKLKKVAPKQKKKLPETNMSPKNRPSQIESSLPTTIC